MRSAVEVEQAAKDEGIAAATLRRARQIVGVQSWKEGSANGRWWWKLPDGDPRLAGEAAQSKMLNPIDSQVSAFASSDNHAKMLNHAPRERLPSEQDRFGDKAAA
jgi:hypothetical protein